jgi:hypothetical protein
MDKSMQVEREGDSLQDEKAAIESAGSAGAMLYFAFPVGSCHFRPGCTGPPSFKARITGKRLKGWMKIPSHPVKKKKVK